MLTTSLSLTLGATLAAVMGLISYYRLRALTPMDTLIWPRGWPHEPPDHTPSIVEAHHIMQRHRECLRDECPRKQAAFQALVEAGHIKPDVSRTR
jgi:hypothetical protein